MAALDLKLDPATGDLDITTGALLLVEDDAEGIAQRLQTRLRLYLGEWALDVTQGVPWRESVMVRGQDTAPARAVLTAQILGTPGVIALDALDIAIDGTTRVLTFSFRALAELPQTGLEDGADTVVVTGDGALADGEPDLLCLIEGPGGFF